MSTNTPSTSSPAPVMPKAPSGDQICADFESMVSSRVRVRLADLAARNNTNTALVRRTLEVRYGNKIVFRRGRTGGIMKVG